MCLSMILRNHKKPSTKNVYYCIGRNVNLCMYDRYVSNDNKFLASFIFRSLIHINEWQDARNLYNYYVSDNYNKKYLPYFHVFVNKEDALKYLNIKRSDGCFSISNPRELVLMSCKVKSITNVGLQNSVFCVVARYKKTLGYEKIEISNETNEFCIRQLKENNYV